MLSQQDVRRKIDRCLALAADSRGDPATARIALRQAAALMQAHAIQHLSNLDRDQIDWTKRKSSEAWLAGLDYSVVCSDGIYVP